jgi:hypothetical protein
MLPRRGKLTEQGQGRESDGMAIFHWLPREAGTEAKEEMETETKNPSDKYSSHPDIGNEGLLQHEEIKCLLRILLSYHVVDDLEVVPEV